MLKGKQRAYLRAIANNLEAILIIGKGGLNDQVIEQFSLALKAREIVKGGVLNTCETDIEYLVQELSKRVKCEIVQIIGNKFVIYKPNPNNRKIILPKSKKKFK